MSSTQPVESPPEELSTSDLVRKLTEQTRTLVTDEVALAKAEMTVKAKAVGVGAGLAGAGTVLALGGGLALIAAAIAALALVLPVWASALIVGVVLIAVGGVLALVAKKRIQAGTPPVPEQAIASTKRDVETVKAAAHGGGEVRA
jgi:tetrahydromethanopterin S-methyltransferase subunit C